MLDLRGKTILVADDEEDIRDMLVSYFENLGCIILTAANGRDAFEILQGKRIDFVISDLKMPGGDGLELLSRIQKELPYKPRVVLISSYSSIGDQLVEAEGAHGLVYKPFQFEEISNLLKSCDV